MTNPYLVSELRHAERVLRKTSRPFLANSARVLRGALFDTIEPDAGVENNARNVINIAFGGPIHA